MTIMGHKQTDLNCLADKINSEAFILLVDLVYSVWFLWIRF